MLDYCARMFFFLFFSFKAIELCLVLRNHTFVLLPSLFFLFEIKFSALCNYSLVLQSISESAFIVSSCYSLSHGRKFLTACQQS